MTAVVTPEELLRSAIVERDKLISDLSAERERFAKALDVLEGKSVPMWQVEWKVQTDEPAEQPAPPPSKKSPRKFTAEQKQRIADQARRDGVNPTCRTLNITQSAVRRWMRQYPAQTVAEGDGRMVPGETPVSPHAAAVHETKPDHPATPLPIRCQCGERFADYRQWFVHYNKQPAGARRLHRIAEQPATQYVPTGLPPNPAILPDTPDVVFIEHHQRALHS